MGKVRKEVMEELIRFENVKFRYDAEDTTQKNVIDGVSFSVEKGSFICILGHNGSGKSTLSKLTNAILTPTQGKVFVKGMDTCDENMKTAIRRTVGMVFQNPDNQIVATVVEDDVAFGPENLGVEPREIRKRVDEALKSVGMYDFRFKEPHNLSGGQKQRVAIAGVIAMQTECIVLDEPTAMLDPRGRKSVMETVKRLNKEMGITVLFITHYMDEAVEADRVIVMDNGRIISDGEPRKVFSDVSLLKNSGLDVPESTELACRLKESGINIKCDVLTADEFISAFEDVQGVNK